MSARTEVRPTLETLLARPDLWRAHGRVEGAGLATGEPSLDALLPGGGWPRGALVEVLSQQAGIGELSLLLPALAPLSRQRRWLAWVAPPHLPYAPALEAAGVDLARVLIVRGRSPAADLWAMTQMLRAGTCGAVLGWPGSASPQDLRRLQLAAEQGGCTGFLFRSPSAAAQPSPAVLRLTVQTEDQGESSLQLLKRRGGGQARLRLVRPALPTAVAATVPPVAGHGHRQLKLL